MRNTSLFEIIIHLKLVLIFSNTLSAQPQELKGVPSSKIDFKLNAGDTIIKREFNKNGLVYYDSYYLGDKLIKILSYKYYQDHYEFITYDNGSFMKPNGECKIFYNDGTLFSQINYVKGELDGEVKSYYSSGIILLIQKWDNGLLLEHNIFKENGEEYPKTDFKNGTGTVVYYSVEGVPYCPIIYKKGKKKKVLKGKCEVCGSCK